MAKVKDAFMDEIDTNRLREEGLSEQEINSLRNDASEQPIKAQLTNEADNAEILRKYDEAFKAALAECDKDKTLPLGEIIKKHMIEKGVIEP